MTGSQLSRRGLLGAALLGAAGVCGCGFRPLYSDSGGASGDSDARLAAIYVTNIPDRTGQVLRQALQQRLEGSGSDVPKRFELAVAFSLSEDAVSYLPDTATTRIRDVGRASWTLHSVAADPKLITSGNARSLDGSDMADGQFFFSDMATGAAQQRIAEAIADQITEQLARYFRQHPTT